MNRTIRTLAILSAALLVPACGRSHSGGASAPPAASAPASVGVQVSPSSATVFVGTVQTFSVAVSGTPTAAVVWSVNGIVGGNGAVGTIEPTSGGAQYAPIAIPTPDPVVITATSQDDPSLSGSSIVLVEYPHVTSSTQSLPIKLGTSGGNVTDITPNGSSVTCCSGTLGCLVRRDGTFFILSNNHVLDKSGRGTVGDAIAQPGLIDNRCNAGTRVATLFQSAPVKTSNVDAAIAQIVPGAVDTSGAILDLGAAGSSGIASAPPSSTLAVPSSVLAGGGRVSKTGRSTGLTCGPLLSINTDVSVDYADTCDGATAFTVIFRDQLLIDGGTFSASGDSGSLIVTSDASRPLGLLFAGNAQSTVAHPIAAVLEALRNASSGEVPVIVGGSDHPVSCAPTASLSQAKTRTLEAAPSSLEFDRASAAKDKLAAPLLEDAAVAGLGIGTSRDDPSEGAILIYLRGIPGKPLPRQLGGVRTRIVLLEKTARAEPSLERLDQAKVLKERHSAALLGRAGVLGVGVGRSEDAEGEPALVVYVERGSGFARMAVELEGIRIRIVEGERFRTFGWGKSRSAEASCCGDR